MPGLTPHWADTAACRRSEAMDSVAGCLEHCFTALAVPREALPPAQPSAHGVGLAPGSTAAGPI